MENVLPLLLWVAPVLIVIVIYWLLERVTAVGGASDRGALDTANQMMSEANAFRGSRSDADPPWDGQKRMAPPTQDGGI